MQHGVRSRAQQKGMLRDVETLLRRGHPLTIVQISERIGISRSVVNRVIKKLIADGFPVKSEKQGWGAIAYWIEKEKAS